ncbi:Sec63 Brl domain family protein [Saccharomyces cerevisiae]|nr:Sec63 Brl domain family protein [Saccharomyces cerevisiae]
MKTKFDRLGTGKRSRPSPNNIDFNDQSATFKRNKKNSRQPSFKVGLSYNSLLDDCDDENETEEIFEGRGLQFFDKDDNFSITADDTQVTSKLFDHDLEQTPDEEAKKPKKVTIRKSAKKCLSTTILPDSFRGVFKFTEFNKMQSEAFPSIYESNENCIISSPTGSGKTVLFELAILRLIKETNSDTNNTKIIYIAPTKSLCYEMYKNWFPSFVNLSVGMLTKRISCRFNNILCSTSTLAVGVNLPAYLVIIKGTKSWNSSEIQEYSDLDILQMIGRAGRPQFETHGCAVIMTDSKMKQTYENLIHGTDVLESSLHLNLIEHLAAETSLETVYSIETAVNWLRNTFFYVRFGKNPAAYQEVNRYVSFHSVEDSQINQFCQYLLDTLVKVKIIDISNGEYKSTAYGNAMTRHYISFESMKQFINAKKFLSLQGILNLLATSEEFSVMRVRHNEKKLFKEINLSPLLKYPFLTEKKQSQIIDRVSQKVSLLIQYELGGLEFPSYEGASKLHQTLVQDKFLVFRHCFRLLKCMVDTFIEKSDGTSLKNTLFLLRSLNGHCWENTPMVLRQLKTIGLVSVRRLIRHGITNLEEMGHLSDTQIEYYLNLKIGNGTKIKNDISLLPCLNIRTKLENCKIENEELWLTFKVEISATFKSSIWHGQHLSLDIETEKSSGELIDFRRLQLNKLQSPRGFRISAKISPKLEKIEFSIHCQEIAGLGKTIVYSTDHLASQFSAKTPNIRKDLNSLEKCLFYESSSDGEVGKTSRVSHKDGLEESLSSDDSILDYLNERKKSSKAVESAAVIHPEAHSSSHFSNGRQVRSNGNYECFHSCKDKTQCRHLCCKEGIPVKYIKEKGPSSIKPVSKPDQIRQPLLAKNINTTPHLEKRLNSKPKQWQEENTDIATVHTLPSKIYNLSQQISSMEAGEQVLKSGPENCPEIIPIDLESSDSYSSNTAASSISDPNGDLDFLGSDIEFE